MAATLAWFSASAFEARAQVPANIQSTLQTYTPRSALPGSDLLQPSDNTGACTSDGVFILILSRKTKELHFPPLPVKDAPDKTDKDGKVDVKQNPIVKYFGLHKQEAVNLLAEFFRTRPKPKDIEVAIHDFYLPHRKTVKTGPFEIETIIELPVPFCSSSASRTLMKFSLPFNPTGESNVLKSDQSNSAGTSLGFGGNVQLFVPGANKFDVIGLGASEQSVRYGQFASKSFDSVTSQAAYQLFLSASGYKTDTDRIQAITRDTHDKDIPPLNMITVESVAFGFQNQTVYTPGFHTESVNLFTPQVTYNIQNLPLAGHTGCNTEIPDPRKQGFCYFADFSFTGGQTFSDVATQQNSNFSVSMTPGKRIDYTDLKLTLPITVTERFYVDVPGGRNDVLFQIGPALTYAPPPFFDATGGSYSALFSVSATYNQNYSTVATAAWHGFIIMPTLTVAFQPAPALH
jgi:hypothetical protein